jgi:hypothetical protein
MREHSANEHAWDDRVGKKMLTVRFCFALVRAAAQHFLPWR